MTISLHFHAVTILTKKLIQILLHLKAADLKAFAAKTLFTLNMHLDSAKGIKGDIKLGWSYDVTSLI